MLWLGSRIHFCFNNVSNELKFSGKGLKRQKLDQSGDGPLEKSRKALEQCSEFYINKQVFEQRITPLQHMK